jgi:hypothetical protein
MAGAVAALGCALACGPARAQQDENPTTPGAIPNPGTYQGSTELQRRSDQQDQQFRQQPQQPYQQPQYGAPRQSGGRGYRPAPGGPAPLTPLQSADLGAVNSASPAWNRGDYATAMRIYRPVAERGGPLSQYNVGVMYEQGLGVPKNYALAMSLFRKSAAQGFAIAMLNLGVMYGQGEGVPIDDVQAYRWFSLVGPHCLPAQAEAGAAAARYRAMVVKRMTRAQIAQAETLVRTSAIPFIR